MMKLPRGAEKVSAVRNMFDTIAPRYDLVNKVMTFGLDATWRKRSMRELRLPKGSTVIDIACGTGDYCRLLTSAIHKPVGIDISYGMLANARTSAPLVQADALAMPFPSSSIDGATSGFALRNFVDLPAFFNELARVIRPGGRILLLDAYQPSSKALRAGHAFYFGKVVPKIGGLLSDPAAYRYLPKSLEYLPPISEIVQSLTDAGFRDVVRETYTGGTVHLFHATRAFRSALNDVE